VAESQVEEKPKPKVAAEKAEFKTTEKPVKLEKIPELEQAAQTQKKGRFGRPVKEKKPEEQPKKEITLTAAELRPTITMAAARWNQFLEAPVGDEKAKYRWNEQDTDNIIKAMEALDAKYHFMGNWLQFAPEIFALIVVGGIMAKLVMGARWKNAQNLAKPAAGQETVKPAAPPTIMERIQGAIKPKSGTETIPPDLAKDATEYLKQAKP
jgi:hypothetical protein